MTPSTGSAPADFDAERFLGNANVSGALSTQSLQCPEGTYRGQVTNKDPTFRTFAKKDQSGEQVTCVFMIEVLDENVKAQLERDSVQVPYTCWLDFDASGGLDTGKGRNADLGRLLEATGQNGRAGNPFQLVKEQLVTIKVTQRSDKDNPEVKYAEVKRVSAAE